MFSSFSTSRRNAILFALVFGLLAHPVCLAHGTVISPASRVYRVYQANPSNPSFALAANAVAIDGANSYYTWNEVSRNIPQALTAGLPPAFDYSPWVPDGQLASGGRVDPLSPLYPRTYAGLDQVSSAWPTTPVTAGQTINVQFLATAAHNPSVWDVWMTTPGWDPNTPLSWSEMEFLGRPSPVQVGQNYEFPLTIPANRSGHHVLWIAWQRNDPAGEVFFSTSDILVAGNGFTLSMTTSGGGAGDFSLGVSGIPAGALEGFTLFSFDTSAPVGTGSLLGVNPDWLTWQGLAKPASPGNPFHFLAPFPATHYPGGAYQLPAGALSGLSGQAVDAVVGVVDSSFTLLGSTNVSRVVF